MITFGRNCKIRELERVIEEYQNQLFSFAFFRVGSMDIAQDIVQDVFLQLYHQNSKLSNVQNMKGYLFRSISNKCADHRRKAKPNFSLESVKAGIDESDKLFYDEYFAIEDILEEIPLEQAEILKLHFVDDLSFVEIASILDLSPNTVKSRYRYGIDKLRKSSHFKNYEYDE